MKKVAVIGFPIKHSLSPKLHSFWIKKYKIEAEYNALEISPDNFNRETLNKYINEGYIGFNITIPHKEKALQIVDEITSTAKAIGAVNTIYLKDNKLIGTNTDAYGFIENIKQNSESFAFANKTAILLGSGGAARSIIYGMIKENINKIILLNRTYDNALKMQKEFGEKIEVQEWKNRNSLTEQADILINSTSLGMVGSRELEVDLIKLKKTALVTDIVYNPLITNLLKQAKNNGNPIVDGIGMLLYQAVDGFNYWFGKKPDVDNYLKEYIL